MPTAQLVEILAHEFEHVIEQLDGVELRADPSHGVYQLANGSFETARAVHIGRQVSGEADAANRVARRRGAKLSAWTFCTFPRELSSRRLRRCQGEIEMSPFLAK